MELVQIVDRNGDFIGQVMDKDEAHDKNLLHNEIAVLIVNDKKETLLQKRSTNKRFDPNRWSICAGHVEASENIEDAALRELEEEVGLKIPKSELYPLLDKQLFIRDTNSHVAYWYYVKSNLNEGDFIIQEEELSEVKWVNIDEVIKRILDHDQSIVFDEGDLKYFEKVKELI